MATIYSLICWGGKDGKVFGSINTTTNRVTMTNHGLRNAMGFKFTSGALPTVSGTALDNSTTYYAKWVDSNTFEVYREVGLSTIVDFTSSTTPTIKGSYYLALSDKSRWTYSTVEYIFDGIKAWRDYHVTTNPAVATDIHFCEIGEAFTDTLTAQLTLSIPAAEVTIWTKVNGVRSAGYHNGLFNLTTPIGYVIYSNTLDSGSTISYAATKHTLDGLALWNSYNGGSSKQLISTGALTTIESHIKNCIIYGTGGGNNQTGLQLTSMSGCQILHNIFYGFSSAGFQAGEYCNRGCMIANNLAAGCGTGFAMNNGATAQESFGWYYNNISVGNTTNWGLYSSTRLIGAGYNGGAAGNTPWYKTTDTGIKTLTADNTTFQNYAGLDFRPAGTAPNTSVGPQVDTGTTLTSAYQQTDMKDFLRPAYNNGGAESWDLGPFEFDRGYQRPNSQTVATSGMADGSRVKIAKQSDGTELRNVLLSGATSDSFTYSVPTGGTPVYLYLRKGSVAPYYKPVKVAATISDDNGLSYSFSGLQVEDIAASTYSAGVATDWTINTTTGSISHTSGTTRYTVQDLYSYHQNYTDDSATVDDDPLMNGITPTMFELINTGTISDADLQMLKGGSIEFPNGTVWSNIYHAGSLTGSPAIYLYQGSSLVTSFWDAGTLDVLVKTNDAGTLVNSGLVTAFARKWGYTFDHYEVDCSGGGRNVAPLSTLVDANNTTARTTVAAYTGITFTFGTLSRDFGDGDGARTYYCEIDCGNLPLSQVYEYSKYKTDESNTDLLNGVPGKRYLSAHSTMAAVKSAPFGIYAGGVWTCAPGVYLTNVPSADRTNYIVTDSIGGTHQNEIIPGAANATVLAGSRVQLYNVDTATEIDNVINADTSYSYAITTEAAGGETLRLRVTKLGYEPVEVFGVFDATAGVTFLVSQSLDPIYTVWGIDGSTVSEFSLDVTGTIEIDANDADGSTLKTRLGAWYNYALTTADGVRSAFGAITPVAANAIRINVDVLDLQIENTNSVTALRFADNDVRLYRSDGTSVIAPSSYSIHNDYSGVPDVVETGVSGLTGAESSQLFGLSNNVNIISVAGVTVNGTGTDLDPWGPV